MRENKVTEVVIPNVVKFHCDKTVLDELTRLGYRVKNAHSMKSASQVFPLAVVQLDEG